MGRFTGLWTHKPAITNPNNSGAGGLYTAVFLRARGFKPHNQSSVTSEANYTRVTRIQSHTHIHTTSLRGKDWWWRWNFVWNSSNFNPVRTFPYFHIYLFALQAYISSLHIISALLIAWTAPYLMHKHTETHPHACHYKGEKNNLLSGPTFKDTCYSELDRAVNESLHFYHSW